MRGAESGGRGVLEGAFAVLEALSTTEGGLGLSEISRRADLPKATVHRLLEQLSELGAVERRDRRYRIGALVSWLGRAWRPDPGLNLAARGPSERLAEVSGANVALCAKFGPEVYISSMVTVAALPYARQRAGTPLPPGTACSAVLLDGESDRVVVDAGRVVAGLYCVAAPVRDEQGRTVAALGAMTMAGRRVEQLIELVRVAAEATTGAMAGPVNGPIASF
ncbi:IclR family transcriptional regulator [Amycolatopsis sp. cg5]|uniref:IclR family transcriptional regulator n=1 Tax=Amycolatopsis sp. cg5 TaxID=3238802 RepID=UPI00352325B9